MIMTQSNLTVYPIAPQRGSSDSETETQQKLAFIFSKVQNILFQLHQYKERQSQSFCELQATARKNLTINPVLSMILWDPPRVQTSEKGVQSQPRQQYSQVIKKIQSQKYFTNASHLSSNQSSVCQAYIQTPSKFASTKYVKQICLSSHLKACESRMITPSPSQVFKTRKLSLIINKKNTGKKQECSKQKIKLCKTLRHPNDQQKNSYI